eukprot:scaffold68234_cov26-Tisochrysis_lutea.AAC.2
MPTARSCSRNSVHCTRPPPRARSVQQTAKDCLRVTAVQGRIPRSVASMKTSRGGSQILRPIFVGIIDRSLSHTSRASLSRASQTYGSSCCSFGMLRRSVEAGSLLVRMACLAEPAGESVLLTAGEGRACALDVDSRADSRRPSAGASIGSPSVALCLLCKK